MGKKEFYIYQEDLIKYKESQVPVNLSKFVKDLNIKFCEEDMKKLRTEKITTFLVERGYLLEGEERYRRPTTKGKLLGIFTDTTATKPSLVSSPINVILFFLSNSSFLAKSV